jgi:peptidase M23-like protein
MSRTLILLALHVPLLGCGYGAAARPATTAPPASSARPDSARRPAAPPAALVAPQLSVLPAQPLIERRGSQQLLNFDIRIDSAGGPALTLAQIDLTVLDAKGTVLHRRFIGGNGFGPPIQTVPQRALAPGEAIAIFNPFHALDASLGIATMHYRLTFTDETGKQEVAAELDVKPIGYVGQAKLVLPVRGRVLVHDGHDFYAHHRRLDLAHPVVKMLGLKANAARYAYDLAIVDAAGALFRGDGAALADWYGYGTPIVAPAAGVVVALHDGAPDQTPANLLNVGPEEVKKDPSVLMGNYLVIDHGKGEVSVLAHLAQGSLEVKVGDKVKAGVEIAAMGMSGDANMVHLHYELQNGPGLPFSPEAAEGLPSTFRGLKRIAGARAVPIPDGAIDTGDIVESVK